MYISIQREDRKAVWQMVLNNKPKSWKSKSKTTSVLHFYIHLMQVYAHSSCYMWSWLAIWGCAFPEGVKLSSASGWPYIHQHLPGMNMQRKTALFHKALSIKALDMLKLVPLFDWYLDTCVPLKPDLLWQRWHVSKSERSVIR